MSFLIPGYYGITIGLFFFLHFRYPVCYNAYFAAGSDPEFGVSPQTGELLPQGSNGTLLKINFLPNVYGKLYQAKLIVQVYNFILKYGICQKLWSFIFFFKNLVKLSEFD